MMTNLFNEVVRYNEVTMKLYYEALLLGTGFCDPITQRVLLVTLEHLVHKICTSSFDFILVRL